MTEADLPIRIVVLYGGQSAENEVSCVSAAGVLRAIDTSRYEVDAIAITPDGEWRRSDAIAAALAAGGGEAIPGSLDSAGAALAPHATLAPVQPGQKVVVFPVMHGPRGEDGTVQGLLELADVAYVGSGVLGSAVNMDKITSKILAAAAGLPIVKYIAVRDIDVPDDDSLAERVADELGWPVFVKPVNMGSSVGVSRAGDAAELRKAIDLAVQFDEWVLVEEAVEGAREIEIGVLGNTEPRASLAGEIASSDAHEFLDYEDKYLDGVVETVVPADIPDDIAEQARTLAIEAFKVLRCDGLGRVDFFYDEANGRLLFNEINTIPGFTPFSMYPMLWAASGLPYAELIDELVRLAIERHEHRAPHRRLR